MVRIHHQRLLLLLGAGAALLAGAGGAVDRTCVISFDLESIDSMNQHIIQTPHRTPTTSQTPHHSINPIDPSTTPHPAQTQHTTTHARPNTAAIERFLRIPSNSSISEHLRAVTAEPHVAGTPGDFETALLVASKFEEFGFDAVTIPCVHSCGVHI